MSAIKRRRLSKQAWSEVMWRFEGAGATVKRFCAQEGLSTQSFYRWRDRLGGDGEVRAPRGQRHASCHLGKCTHLPPETASLAACACAQ